MNKLIVSNSLSEQTRGIIRDDIISLRLHPGCRLTVDALAARFGISRTPVRDALNALAEEGLVVVAPRVGYYVVDLTAEDIQEISGLRKMVELYAFQLAVHNLTQGQIERMLHETVAAKALPEPEKRKVFEMLDRQFHMEIIYAAKNKRLVDFFMPIQSFVDLMRNLNVRVDEAIDEHIFILEALQSGDMEAAGHALAEHLNIVETMILASDAIKKEQST